MIGTGNFLVPAPSGGVLPKTALYPDFPLNALLAGSKNIVVLNGAVSTRGTMQRMRLDPSLFSGKLYSTPPAGAAAMTMVLGTSASWFDCSNTTTASAPVDLSGGVPITAVPTDWATWCQGTSTYILGVNGTNPNKLWAIGGAAYANWGGSPQNAKCVCPIFERILIGNLPAMTNGARMVDYSDQRDVNSGWNNPLRMTVLLDTPGAITAIKPLGKLEAAIYKEDCIYVAVAQGDTTAFRFELRVPRVEGPKTPYQVLVLPDGTHLFVGGNRGTLYLFDGNSVREVAPFFPEYVGANLLHQNVRLMFHERDRQVWVLVQGTVGTGWVEGSIYVFSYPDFAMFPQIFTTSSFGATDWCYPTDLVWSSPRRIFLGGTYYDNAGPLMLGSCTTSKVAGTGLFCVGTESGLALHSSYSFDHEIPMSVLMRLPPLHKSGAVFSVAEAEWLTTLPDVDVTMTMWTGVYKAGASTSDSSTVSGTVGPTAARTPWTFRKPAYRWARPEIAWVTTSGHGTWASDQYPGILFTVVDGATR